MGYKQQIHHINDVLASIERPETVLSERDQIIVQSWRRCTNQYGLDPTIPREAVILPSARIREHTERIEEFLRVARHGAENLYRSVAAMGFVLLLTDNRGITVEFIGDRNLDRELKRAGLYLGADWNEAHAGTCGVGTCISTGRALTVHQTDHFDATHIPLTCTTAPIFDPFGELLAVLDISALKSPEPKASQYLVLQLAQIYAQKIEAANFMHHFRRHWIIRLSESCEFLDVDPDYLLALDEAGRIQGFNQRMRHRLSRSLIAPLQPAELLGRCFEQFFDCGLDGLPGFNATRPAAQRAIRTLHDLRPLFILASSPALPGRVQPHLTQSTATKLHPALARLSGGDPVMNRLLAQIARLANTKVSILLSGETGTGKDSLARALHQAGPRANNPFVVVNCAAIPESLIESELLGYMPGAFTGARGKGKTGLLQQADQGTLLLDEIGDMPLPLQTRLLRVLAEQEVQPIGACRPQSVNIRIIAASHRNLPELIRRGEFRDDLFYRLNGATFELPPLRARTDIAYLAQQLAHAETGANGPRLSAAVLALLQRHRWPGNIRELRNIMQYACAVCVQSRIEIQDLPEYLLDPPSDAYHPQPPVGAVTSPATGTIPNATLPPSEGMLYQRLREHRWNISAVAREFGVNRSTVYRRMQRYGIVPPHHS
ncbi:MAG: sigma-54-dependent Fis family transcriptional regulator [Candidatus Competibacteraceae bacterium]